MTPEKETLRSLVMGDTTAADAATVLMGRITEVSDSDLSTLAIMIRDVQAGRKAAAEAAAKAEREKRKVRVECMNCNRPWRACEGCLICGGTGIVDAYLVEEKT